MKDFYYILGVDVNCTLNEIKEAYRKLSKKFHPDLNPEDEYFENRFREIKEAYETLVDPDKRRQYDAVLKKFKSNPYSGKQAENPQYQNRPYAFTRRKKGPGTAMSIVLILIALILGVYLVESFSNSKSHKVNRISAISAVSYKTYRHHKKKHNLKNKDGPDSPKINSDSVVPRAIQPVEDNNDQQEAISVKQAVPEGNKNTGYNGNFLYPTYVMPNITGVVNMRKFDNYSSVIIETIPANSKVFVIGKGNIYYKVFFNNHVGYVPRWSLETK